MKSSINIFYNRWYLFIQERFPILKHLLLIVFLFAANAFVIQSTTFEKLSLKSLSICFIVILFTFFRLRIFDEIKDYENDKVVYPDRPLARNLIKVSEAKKVAFILLIIELILSWIIGMSSLIGMLFVSIYSILMYKEFFIASWLRPKLATYAISHTFVSSLISLFIFSAITNQYFWNSPRNYLLFALANWMIFNVFEFGRKTFSKDEEKTDISSYSKSFGSWKAAINVVFMAFIAIIIAFYLGLALVWSPLLLILLITLLLFLITCSIIYGHFNSTKSALKFRLACSTFILLYNLIISLGFIL